MESAQNSQGGYSGSWPRGAKSSLNVFETGARLLPADHYYDNMPSDPAKRPGRAIVGLPVGVADRQWLSLEGHLRASGFESIQ